MGPCEAGSATGAFRPGSGFQLVQVPHARLPPGMPCSCQRALAAQDVAAGQSCSIMHRSLQVRPTRFAPQAAAACADRPVDTSMAQKGIVIDMQAHDLKDAAAACSCTCGSAACTGCDTIERRMHSMLFSFVLAYMPAQLSATCYKHFWADRLHQVR